MDALSNIDSGNLIETTTRTPTKNRNNENNQLKDSGIIKDIDPFKLTDQDSIPGPLYQFDNIANEVIEISDNISISLARENSKLNFEKRTHNSKTSEVNNYNNKREKLNPEKMNL